MSESSTVEVDLSQVREGWNPRRIFDIKGLAEDIRKRGLLVPLEVRLLTKESYEIVDGARRFRALMYLKVEKGIPQVAEKVRVFLVDADEGEAAVMKFTRFEFSEGITESDRMQALADRWDMEMGRHTTLTQETFADRYGVSRSTVANAIRFVAAPKKVLALVEKGELTPSHVTKAVLKFETKKDQVAFAEGFVDRRFGYGGGSVGQAIEVADRMLKEERAREELDRLLKTVGHPACPKCGDPPRALTSLTSAYRVDVTGPKKVKVGKDVQVFQCSRGNTWNADLWSPTTGEVLYTSWDADSAVRRVTAAQERKAKGVSTKQKKKKVKGVGLYEPAWFFSRSSIDWWANELLQANLEAIHIVYHQDNGLDAHTTGKTALGIPFRVEPMEVEDGQGGKFLTRILLVESGYRGFRSGAREDHVGAGGYVQVVQARRKQVLKFEHERNLFEVGRQLPKKPEDWLPTTAPYGKKGDKALTMGQRVRLMDDRKSYDGKKARILAFNTYREKLHFALLDISMSQKAFPLDSLRPLEEEKA